MTCEHCWHNSDPERRPDSYYFAMAEAERDGAPCTKPDEQGARLRAGEYWDAERKIDTRRAPSGDGKGKP